MGVVSRLNGWMIVVVEVGIFLMPLDMVQYFPNLFFGGLMVWIGIDIAKVRLCMRGC